MRKHGLLTGAGAVVFGLLPAVVLAQQASIPVHKLTVVAAADSGVLSNVAAVRGLPDGRVLVNDAYRRRLLMFDSTLATYTTIADTGKSAPNRYGTQFNALIPYLGDSSVFVDRDAGAFVVVDAHGKFVRTFAPPMSGDRSVDPLQPFTSVLLNANAGFDPKGRLVYRVERRMAAGARPLDPTGRPVIASRPDSAAIVRGDLDRRTVDTIATMHIPVMKMVTVTGPNGLGMGTVAINPAPATDDWALLPDGTVAIIRGQDYHIDWVRPDGTRTSTPKMPFDWKRLTLEGKQHMLDSIRRAHDELAAKSPPRAGAQAMPFATVDVSDLPDYYPSLRQGQTRVDREGNLWILPSTSVLTSSGLVFDVVNRKGEVFERVQLPAGRTLVGFGPNGAVYLGSPPNAGQVRLERARIAR